MQRECTTTELVDEIERLRKDVDDRKLEADVLRKWFGYLVDFIHADQCQPGYGIEGPPEKCWCCSDYLDVAKHAARQGGLAAPPEGQGE
jgi:hypothetical protein